jgi:hypothetical protein
MTLTPLIPFNSFLISFLVGQRRPAFLAVCLGIAAAGVVWPILLWSGILTDFLTLLGYQFVP